MLSTYLVYHSEILPPSFSLFVCLLNVSKGIYYKHGYGKKHKKKNIKKMVCEIQMSGYRKIELKDICQSECG